MAQTLRAAATPAPRVYCRDCGARVEADRVRQGLTLCADCHQTAQTARDQDRAHEHYRRWMHQNGEARYEDLYQ